MSALPVLVALDLWSGTLRAPRCRGPPAPLHAALAGGRGELAVAVPAAERLHGRPGPCPEYAVAHVAERRLPVLVALAPRPRPVPEDVGRGPSGWTRAATGAP